jgi:hypothetical protein
MLAPFVALPVLQAYMFLDSALHFSMVCAIISCVCHPSSVLKLLSGVVIYFSLDIRVRLNNTTLVTIDILFHCSLQLGLLEDVDAYVYLLLDGDKTIRRSVHPADG